MSLTVRTLASRLYAFTSTTVAVAATCTAVHYRRRAKAFGPTELETAKAALVHRQEVRNLAGRAQDSESVVLRARRPPEEHADCDWYWITVIACSAEHRSEVHPHPVIETIPGVNYVHVAEGWARTIALAMYAANEAAEDLSCFEIVEDEYDEADGLDG